MWLPRLEFIAKYVYEYDQAMWGFINKNLPLHRAPVIESLRLVLYSSDIKPIDIKRWIDIAVSRHVRELEVMNYLKNENIFPTCFFTCKSLVTLTLCETDLVDVPRMVCLPSLKAFRLEDVINFDADSFQRLLSNCPILDDLWVDGCAVDNMRKLSVITPSLKRLTLILLDDSLDELVIDTPLNYFKLQHNSSKSHYCLIKDMPKLREAYVDVRFSHIKDLIIRSITSVKHLSLCLTLNDAEEDVCGDGFVFNRLEHQELCVCDDYSSNVLVQFLRDSPNLRVLELFDMDDHEGSGIDSWNQPDTVPECMLSSLQTFNWSGYLGRPEERDLAIYILENACRLKTVTIKSQSYEVPTIDMLKELAFSSRASTTCQLVFN